MRTSATFDSEVPAGRRPVNVCCEGRFLGQDKVIGRLDLKLARCTGREAVAILPSGLPVLKKKVLPAFTELVNAHARSVMAAIASFEYINSSFRSREVERGAPAKIRLVSLVRVSLSRTEGE